MIALIVSVSTSSLFVFANCTDSKIVKYSYQCPQKTHKIPTKKEKDLDRWRKEVFTFPGGMGALYAICGKRPSMEDSDAIVTNFRTKGPLYAAIFDGHGGKKVAHLASCLLHSYLAKELASKKKIEQAFKDAFSKTDEKLKKTIKDQSGSTVIVALIDGTKLHIANLGDSRAVISENDTAVRITKDHKTSDEKELARIKKAGGFVFNGRFGGSLAVSRALGDFHLKNEKLTNNEPLSNIPDVFSRTITENSDFLILACDGLWDVIKDQDAVDFVKTQFIQKKTVQQITKALVEKAYVEGSSDNISVMIITFGKTGPHTSTSTTTSKTSKK